MEEEKRRLLEMKQGEEMAFMSVSVLEEGQGEDEEARKRVKIERVKRRLREVKEALRVMNFEQVGAEDESIVYG